MKWSQHTTSCGPGIHSFLSFRQFFWLPHVTSALKVFVLWELKQPLSWWRWWHVVLSLWNRYFTNGKPCRVYRETEHGSSKYRRHSTVILFTAMTCSVCGWSSKSKEVISSHWLCCWMICVIDVGRRCYCLTLGQKCFLHKLLPAVTDPSQLELRVTSCCTSKHLTFFGIAEQMWKSHFNSFH